MAVTILWCPKDSRKRCKSYYMLLYAAPLSQCKNVIIWWKKKSYSAWNSSILQINEIRRLLGPLPEKLSIYCSDATISRYLRARNWNVKKATKMIKETLRWRSEYKPEAIRWVTIYFTVWLLFLVTLNPDPWILYPAFGSCYTGHALLLPVTRATILVIVLAL